MLCMSDILTFCGRGPKFKQKERTSAVQLDAFICCLLAWLSLDGEDGGIGSPKCC
jgi:hypothetical protein